MTTKEKDTLKEILGRLERLEKIIENEIVSKKTWEKYPPIESKPKPKLDWEVIL